MKSRFTLVVLVVLFLGYIVPTTIGLVGAAKSVRADIEARYDSEAYSY